MEVFHDMGRFKDIIACLFDGTVHNHHMFLKNNKGNDYFVEGKRGTKFCIRYPI